MIKFTIHSVVFFIMLFSVNGEVYGQKQRDFIRFANEMFDKGDYYGASIYYRKAIEMDDNSLELNYKYAESLRAFNDYENAAEYYEKVYKKDKGAEFPFAAFHLATMQKNIGDYRQSRKTWKLVSRQYGRDKDSYYYKKAIQEMESCQFATQMAKGKPEFEAVNMEELNTYDSEFGLRLKPDATPVFSSLRAEKMDDDNVVKDANYRVKIYEWDSEKSSSLALDKIINDEQFHTANGTFSSDGSRFYFTRCDDDFVCAIYYTNYKEGAYSEPIKMDTRINFSGYSSTHPQLALVEGQEVLFFSSNQPGTRGKMDIWYSKINGENYSKAVNLGKPVNSIDNEISPFYDSVSQRLYFSSDWHFGLGGYDVFWSEGNLMSWSEPKNAGLGFNTSANDLYFSKYPKHRAAYLTSNRKGSKARKGENCCNDIYKITLPAEDEPDTIPYKSLEDLNNYLPVSLYFHNDEPDPRTTDTITQQNYMATYNAYKKLIPKYKREYSLGLQGEEKENAQDDIEDFFEEYVDQGVINLNYFVPLLLDELEKGTSVNVTIKGFASPLAKTDYNVKLTGRRISSLVNFLKEYEGGVFLPYINGTASNGAVLQFTRIPYGEYKASGIVSDNIQDKKNSIYSRVAALERKIEIISVQRAFTDSVYTQLSASKEVFDFGVVSVPVEKETTIEIKNVGTQTLTISGVEVSGEDLRTSGLESKVVLNVGESKSIRIGFKPNESSPKGKQTGFIKINTNDGYSKLIEFTWEIVFEP
jgi:tetratricopeptide (TPR) repeat protein